MKRFHRVYFDSNVAIKERWPRVSAAFEGLLWMSKLFKIQVVLLDVVERELEAHWVREHQEAQRAIQNIEEIHARVGLPKEATRLPKFDECKFTRVVDFPTGHTPPMCHPERSEGSRQDVCAGK